MELMMYLGNDLIESIPVNNNKLSEPGYLGAFKRQLKSKYYELITGSSTSPEFLIVNMQPSYQSHAMAS
jgi:hypothetical protein